MNLNFDISSIQTPYYIVDVKRLKHNLKALKSLSDNTGCRILLAQKAFSMFSLYPLIGEFLDGTTASGLYEAKLGYEHMGKENHIFSAAYSDNDIDEILNICDCITFNSFNQWMKYKDKAKQANKKFGIRINPECSTQNHAIYDPCSPFSRLGVTRRNFREDLLDNISGIHFHTLCEQNSDALMKTVETVEKNFGSILKKMQWINLGGGHHITRDDYDIELLTDILVKLKSNYDLELYIEPGEAVVLNTGFFICSVMDIIDNGMKIAILDGSAACHMPDVLEMPYRPEILGADKPDIQPFTYRLGGPTCLAGDIIGDYSFDKPLQIGERLVFCDMAHYTMVKNNTFNGMPLPSIAIADDKGEVILIKDFDYEDYKNRLS